MALTGRNHDALIRIGGKLRGGGPNLQKRLGWQAALAPWGEAGSRRLEPSSEPAAGIPAAGPKDRSGMRLVTVLCGSL